MKGRLIVYQEGITAYRYTLYRKLRKLKYLDFQVYHNGLNQGFDHLDKSWIFYVGSLKKILNLRYSSAVWWRNIKKDDVVFVVGELRNLNVWIAILLSLLGRRKVVWWSQLRGPKSNEFGIRLRMVFARLVDGILLYTRHEVEEFNARYPGFDKPLGFASNSVTSLNDLKGNIEFNADARPDRVLFMGRLTKKANFDLLLEAVMKSQIPFSIDVIGDTAADDNIRDKCKQLGLSERVIFHGMIHDRERISLIANKCKFGVYPGSIGLSLFDMLSHSLPVLISDDLELHMPEAKALTEINYDLFFTGGDCQSLVKEIEKALKNPARLNRMSAEGIELIKNKYNIDTMAENIATLAKDVDAIKSVRKIVC